MHNSPENRGTYVDNQNCPFCEVVKMWNGLHHCVPLVETVKKHICNVEFGVWIKGLFPQENLTLPELLTPL